MIAHKAFNIRLWLSALLLAFAVVLFHDGVQHFWDTEHDGAGLYPAQDCGRNHWMFFRVGGEDLCVTHGEDAEKIADEAINQLREEGAGTFSNAEDAMNAFKWKILQILNAIQREVFMY